MHYVDAFNPIISCFCAGDRPYTFNKDFSYAKILEYDNFLKKTFSYYLYKCNVNTFYFFLNTPTDLDLVDALQFTRMRGCGNSRIICVVHDNLRERFGEKDKERYDNILDNCDVKIDIRNEQYIQDLELKTTKRIIDQCAYCLFVMRGEQDSKINLAYDYATSSRKIVNCFE